MADLLDQEPGTAVATREPDSLLNFVALAVKDPNIDVAKLDALLRMQREIIAEHARQAYQAAMVDCQAEIQPVVRDTENRQTQTFYAKLEKVDAAIRPIYLKHGFSLSDDTVPPLIPGNIRVETRCAHREGHVELFHREAPADTMGPKGSATKTILHGGASTETFLRRYLRCGIFNVVFTGMDDDGVRGGRQPITQAQLKEIDDLRRELGVGLESFCRTMAVEALLDLDQSAYPIAMNLLRARERNAKESAT